jgi:hypothetical protein
MNVKYGLIIFLLLQANSMMSQAAYMKNEELSENEIVLIDPSDVSNYFIGQAENYLKEYREIETKIEAQLDTKRKELTGFKTKEIRNAVRIGEANQKIEGLILELEFLNEFISKWESHKMKYLSFQENAKRTIKMDSCYQFEINNDIYYSDEIEISKLEASQVLTFEEVIEDKYMTILRVVDGSIVNEKRQGKGRHYGVPINYETTFIDVRERSIQETLRKEKSSRSNTNYEEDGRITDYGVELIELYFKTMILDENEYVLYKTKTDRVKEMTIQFILESTRKAVIPDSWEIINCE